MYLIRLSNTIDRDSTKLKKEDSNNIKKLWSLILDTCNDPFNGIGKPEALKGDLEGCWSRRITQKHRLIYMVEDDIITFISCYGHYGDK